MDTNAASPIEKLKILLEMIKFQHTIFALPFAYAGALLARRGMPGLAESLWILLAMGGARTVAMGINRIVDRGFDAENPRTRDRALVKGDVGMFEAWLMVIIAAAIYFLAAWNLTPLSFRLSPFFLAVICFYSYTKRFTPFCHLFLGFAIGLAPVAGWIAIANSIGLVPILLGTGVMFWIAGFDVLYACMDAEFDRKRGLHSIPAWLGKEKAFKVSEIFHVIAFGAFTATGIAAHLNWIYFVGIAATFVLLVMQRKVITPTDLSKMNIAFFRLNATISVVLFFATALSLWSVS